MASYMDPKTTATYEEPYAAAQRKGFLDSAYALANQPTPIPVKQVAGLDPYEMQARSLTGGLGGFSPYLQQGAQMLQGGYGTQQQGRNMYNMGADTTNIGLGLYGRGANLTDQASSFYAPGAAQQFYNPYEEAVVQQTLSDLQEKNIGQGIQDRAGQIGQGAFGGSRGRLMAGERQRQLGRGAAEAVGALRQQGFQNAQTTAQNAGRGLGQLGSQYGQFGQGLGQLGSQYGQFGQGLGALGGQMGQMGTSFAGLGTTGQRNLLSQIDSLQGLGQGARNIQDNMYGAQFNAARSLATEPMSRMQSYQGMLGMLPRTTSATTFGNEAGVNPLAGLLQLLGAIE